MKIEWGLDCHNLWLQPSNTTSFKVKLPGKTFENGGVPALRKKLEYNKKGTKKQIRKEKTFS